jgi:hypothetical protein
MSWPREAVTLAKLTVKFFASDADITGRHVIEGFLDSGHVLGKSLFIRMNGPPLIERFFRGDDYLTGR